MSWQHKQRMAYDRISYEIGLRQAQTWDGRTVTDIEFDEAAWRLKGSLDGKTAEWHLNGTAASGNHEEDLFELEEKKAGSTVHAPGCDCGFCKMGYTRL